MSYSFGNTNQPAFGTTPAKATGFGTPFGGAPTMTAPAPTFGTAFGTPSVSATPSFGSAFGTPATSAPAFGTSFGASTSTAPVFGTSFGTPVASSAPNLFGSSTTRPSLFSTPATSTPSLFSTPTTSSNLFGGTAPTQTSSLFGSGGTATVQPTGFASATTTAPTLFGGGSFNTATTTTPSLFGTTALGTSGGTFNLFGATTSAPSLFSGFGTTTTTSQSPGFMGFGTAVSSGFGTGGAAGFGASNTSGVGAGNTWGFGTGGTAGFGTATNTGFGGFRTGAAAAPMFGPRPPGVTAEDKNQQILASFYAINLFGDERDDIIKKWNMLQACWGTGKGYYNSNQPPVEYDHCNPFFRFKTIGYVVLPTTENADGFVKLLFHKKESELNATRESLINGLGGILGNKPNLTVKIEHIKAISESDSEVMITVSEKGVTGTSRKIQSTDLTAFLNQPGQKQQLSNVGVFYIGPFTCPSKAEIQEYLKTPPQGIDVHMWHAAQTDNPLPHKYLPTPMNGFTDLKRRMLCEEYETSVHRAFLEKANNEISELKRKHAASISRITEQKQKFLQLQHRVLRILVKQEVTRKVGLALQPEEEILRSRLEMLYSHLNVPTQFRGRLNELLSTVKMMNVCDVMKNEKYKMEPKAQDDIKQFLNMEQDGISHLINIINKDIKDLKIICDGLTKITTKN